MRKLALAIVAAGCGSSGPRAPGPDRTAAAAAVPAAPPVASHDRVPEPTPATGGGARCSIGTAIRLGATPRPRVAATAFQKSGGLAVWLGGAEASQLVVQPLAADGQPTGAATETALASSAILDGLATVDGYYVVLVRTAGSDQRLGSAAQVRIQLMIFDHAGAAVAESTVRSGRWRDEPILRFRDGALRVIVEYDGAVVSPPNAEVVLEPLPDPSYYRGGYWAGDADLSIDFYPAGEDQHFQMWRTRLPNTEVGAPIDLPVKELDFYAVEDGVVVLENIGQKPRPRWAWDGHRYLVSTVARDDRAGTYVTQLLPITCS